MNPLQAGDYADDPKKAEQIRKRQEKRAAALEIEEMLKATRPTLARSNVKYELFAVCHHTGSIKAGHYYAYIKGKKGSHGSNTG